MLGDLVVPLKEQDIVKDKVMMVNFGGHTIKAGIFQIVNRLEE